MRRASRQHDDAIEAHGAAGRGRHVRQRGDMPYTTLVRGRDEFGYFRPDPVPGCDFDPAVLALFPNRKPVQHQAR